MNEQNPLEKALSIQDRNARFDALSPEERRVAIAMDVIAQINTGRLVAHSGRYILKGGYGSRYQDNPVETVQELADADGETCRVCARGAEILTAARLFNRAPEQGVGELMYRFNKSPVDPLGKYEQQYFDTKQIGLIEAAFEMDERYYIKRLTEEEREDASEWELADEAFSFGELYADNPELRMVAIYANVIEGGGTFDPLREVDPYAYLTPKSDDNPVSEES